MRDATKPLRSRREEAYAFERSLGYRPCEAARRAGMDDRTGVQTKYEKKPRVRARIDELRKNDLTLEYREAKRRHLEERLELAAFGSIAEFLTLDQYGVPHVDYRKLLESDLAATVHELRLDGQGRVTAIARDAPLNAIAQLREMRGFKAAEQRNVTLAIAEQLTDDELLRIAAQEGAAENAALPALPAPVIDAPETTE